jgi:hypothetical protein
MDGSDEVSSKQRVKGSDPSANNTDDISVWCEDNKRTFVQSQKSQVQS